MLINKEEEKKNCVLACMHITLCVHLFKVWLNFITHQCICQSKHFPKFQFRTIFTYFKSEFISYLPTYLPTFSQPTLPILNSEEGTVPHIDPSYTTVVNVAAARVVVSQGTKARPAGSWLQILGMRAVVGKPWQSSRGTTFMSILIPPLLCSNAALF